MKYVLILLSLAINANGQKSDPVLEMVQNCLADSSFKSMLFQLEELECKDIVSYQTHLNSDLNFKGLVFNGVELREHNYYLDTALCSPIGIYVTKKRRSKVKVLISYSIYLTPICEGVEGHGKTNGCFSRRVISMERIFKLKRDGEIVIKDTDYRSIQSSGKFL